MLINTRDFGMLEVDDENIITFAVGPFAFEDAKDFALISPLGEEAYPKWLQCVDSLAPCFIVFDPEVIDDEDEDFVEEMKSDFFDCVSQNELHRLKIDEDSADNNDIRILVIATVPDDFKKTTVNLKAPIIINVEENLAAQVILSEEYTFRYPLYQDEEDE